MSRGIKPPSHPRDWRGDTTSFCGPVFHHWLIFFIIQVQIVGGELLHSKKNGDGYVDSQVILGIRIWVQAFTIICRFFLNSAVIFNLYSFCIYTKFNIYIWHIGHCPLDSKIYNLSIFDIVDTDHWTVKFKFIYIWLSGHCQCPLDSKIYNLSIFVTEDTDHWTVKFTIYLYLSQWTL